MAKIQPFQAYRPTRDKAHLVASRPVATYKTSILAAKLEENPYTFIHIIHPEYFEDEVNRTQPNSKERFLKVKHKFEEFCGNGILKQDLEAHFYIYQQTKNGHVFRGLIAGASVEEYQNNQIKKHEATLTSRENMFAHYLDVVGVNAEPVLLSYPKNERIAQLMDMVIQSRPENEFSTTDGVLHELWLVPHNQTKDFQHAFEQVPVTYIADGHHRSASSAKLHENYVANGKATANGNHDYFLSYFIEEERLQILPFNRLCKSLNGLSDFEFLEALQNHFELTELQDEPGPIKLHVFHMFFKDKWYQLIAKPDILIANSAVDTIDAELLTRYILDPILGIKDLKTDDSISFLSGSESKEVLENKVKSGKYQVAFSLFPVTVDQLKKVADENAIMPPKSTFIEPKLRSGLTVYKIEK